MSINAAHFESLIVQPVLKHLNMWSKSADVLMMGTCAKESHMGTYLRQVGGGPGLGPYQIEPSTHEDVWRYLDTIRPDIRARVLEIGPRDVSALVHNLHYSTAIARIRYWWEDEDLPAPDNLFGMGRYWDKYYNCNPAKGTAAEFVDCYRRYVK